MRGLPLLPLLILAACTGEPEAAAPPAPKPVAPRTAVAESAQDGPLARVPALVSLPPEARVAVAAPVAGFVREVRVLTGQQVRPGETLAVLESREALALEADRARADGRLALAEATVRRQRQLVEEGIVAAARLEEAEAERLAARAERNLAARSLARAGAAGDGIVRVRAPIAGRVAEVGTTTGAAAEPGTSLFMIERVGPLLLELQLPEGLAGRVRPGMAVALPSGATGQILSVAPGLDISARSITAMARIAAVQGLVPGSSLEVTILAPAGPGAVAVPAEAVVRDGARDIVFVAGSDGFRPRAVSVSSRSNGVALILSGVKPGERVAISNLPELRASNGG